MRKVNCLEHHLGKIQINNIKVVVWNILRQSKAVEYINREQSNFNSYPNPQFPHIEPQSRPKCKICECYMIKMVDRHLVCLDYSIFSL